MRKLIVFLALLGCARGATVLRIACGGPGGTDAQGNVWAADGSFSGGARWDATSQAAMAAQPIPYRSLRYATSFSYTLPLPAGEYKITLKFLEPNKTGGGQRIFTVSANGSQAIAGLDLYSVAGALKAYDRTFAATSNGQIRIDLTAAAGNAVLSAIQVDDVPIVKPPDAGGITCESGTITVGVELTADAPSQEVTILRDVPGNRRWEQVTICPTTRFLGQQLVTASIGRPGSNNSEMTGADAPLIDASNDSNCWTARPSPPQLIGTYDVVVNFKAFAAPAVPGSIRNLTSGVASWEACGYAGKLGDVAQGSQPIGQPKVLQCSGSFSHTDINTGKVITTSDCGGILWAQLGGLDIVGVPMVPSLVVGTAWTRIR